MRGGQNILTDYWTERTQIVFWAICKCLKNMAGTTRLELATSAVTGQRSNQLNYVPAVVVLSLADGGQCRARTCDLLLVRQAL